MSLHVLKCCYNCSLLRTWEKGSLTTVAPIFMHRRLACSNSGSICSIRILRWLGSSAILGATGCLHKRLALRTALQWSMERSKESRQATADKAQWSGQLEQDAFMEVAGGQ